MRVRRGPAGSTWVLDVTTCSGRGNGTVRPVHAVGSTDPGGRTRTECAGPAVKIRQRRWAAAAAPSGPSRLRRSGERRESRGRADGLQAAARPGRAGAAWCRPTCRARGGGWPARRRPSPRTRAAPSTPPARRAGRRSSPGCGGRRDGGQHRRHRASPPPTRARPRRPTSVSPRHQMPSTSSGQNDEAATANASPTTRRHVRGGQRQQRQGTSDARWPATTAERGRRRQPVRPGRARRGEHPGHRREQARRVDRNAANAPAATRAPSSSPASPPPSASPGSTSTTASVSPVDEQLGRVDAAEHAVQRREQVEHADQAEHDQRGAAGGRAVRVGVEADQHVRQAHRAEERGQDERVGRVERVVAPAEARQRGAPTSPPGDAGVAAIAAPGAASEEHGGHEQRGQLEPVLEGLHERDRRACRRRRR